MGLFDSIGQVKASLDANYVKPGHYLFLIENGKLSKARDEIPFVVLEMVCVKVFGDTADYQPVEDPSAKGHFVGERASHLIKNGGPGKDMFLPNIKAMVTGVMGIGEDAVKPELVESIFVTEGKESEWRGLVVEVEARNRKTNAGKTFTRVSYKSAIDPDSFEELGVVLPNEWREKYEQND